MGSVLPFIGKKLAKNGNQISLRRQKCTINTWMVHKTYRIQGLAILGLLMDTKKSSKSKEEFYEKVSIILSHVIQYN